MSSDSIMRQRSRTVVPIAADTSSGGMYAPIGGNDVRPLPMTSTLIGVTAVVIVLLILIVQVSVIAYNAGHSAAISASSAVTSTTMKRLSSAGRELLFTNGYVAAKGAKQGDFISDLAGPIANGGTAFDEITHEIEMPHDPATGLVMGKRLHKPFVFTKHLDKNTPKWYQAMTMNENLVSITFTFTRTVNGQEKKIFHITLTNARIVKMSVDYTIDPNSVAKTAKDNDIEQIHLTYQTILWSWETGVSYEDNWSPL